ncbi:MAG: hypothetical protein HY401_04440 [Elusimicrobia bacterium]|nr:hypothetical protein [Elusimicrobiota bacterium]
MPLCLSAFPPFAFPLEPGGAIVQASSYLSRDLKNKIQEHLDKTFGTGNAEVFVHVDVGFSLKLKEELQNSLSAYLSGQLGRTAKDAPADDAGAENPSSYKWLFPGIADSGDPQASGTDTFILPGFSAVGTGVSVPTGGAPPGSRKAADGRYPFSDPNFLYAVGLEVKSVFVKVALDYSLPADAEAKVQTLIGSFLTLDAARGDRLVVTRFSMPNPFMELLKDSKVLGTVLQWGTIGIILIIGLVATTFLALITWRSLVGVLAQWVVAFSAARQKSIEVKFEFPDKLRAYLEGRMAKDKEGEDELPGGAGDEKLIEMAAQKSEAPGEAEIKIAPARVADLYHLIGQENPNHIALVVARLPVATKKAFLEQFPSERLGEVIKAMAEPQMVETELMERLKEELEHRIAGVVGGAQEIVNTLNAVDLLLREKMLKTIESQDANLYRIVRGKVLLFGDITYWSEQELNMLLSRVQIHELAIAISDGLSDPGLKDKIFHSLPKKTSQILQEYLVTVGRPPVERILQAQNKILKLAEEMILQNTLPHPMDRARLSAQ